MKCCMPGCEDRTSTRDRFPNPTKDAARFNIWIEVIGNPKLVEVDPMRIYRNVRVCLQHFTIKDTSSYMYLFRTARPSQWTTHRIQGPECDYYYYMNNYFIQ